MSDAVAIYEAVSGALITGDWDAVRAKLADDVRYRAGSGEVITGAEGTLDTLKYYIGKVARLTGRTIRHSWDDGTRCAIEMDAYYDRVSDGKSFSIACTDVLVARDGKVQEWRVYADISPMLRD